MARKAEPLIAHLAERRPIITGADILAIKNAHVDKASADMARPVDEWRRRADTAAEVIRQRLGQAINAMLHDRQLSPGDQGALARRLAERSEALLGELGIDSAAAADGRLTSPFMPAPVQHILCDLAPLLPPHRAQDEVAVAALRGSARLDDVVCDLVERRVVSPEDAPAGATAAVLLELLPHAIGALLSVARAAEIEARAAGKGAAGRPSDPFALMVLGGMARAHEAMFDAPIQPFATQLPRHGISAAAWVKSLAVTLGRNLRRGSALGDDSKAIADRLDSLLPDRPGRDNGAARADRALMELLQKAARAEASA